MEIFAYVSLALAGICTAVGLWKVIGKWLLYIPPNGVAVVFSANNQVSVRRQGYTLVKWPFESVSEVNWSYYSVNATGQKVLKTTKSRFISTQAFSVDTPPYRVRDRAGVTVEVDVTFRVTIVDPIIAVTQHANLLGFLAECIEAATSVVINSMDYREVIGRNAYISDLLQKDVEFQLRDSGCKINVLLVQSITPSSALGETAEIQSVEAQKALIEKNKLEQKRILDEQQLAHRESVAAATHENEMKEMQRRHALESANVQHERELALARQQCKMQQAQQAFEIARIANEELRLKQDTDLRPSQLEQEQRLKYIGELVEKGFTPERIVDLINGVEVAKQMAIGLASNTKMIMSPEHYRQMLYMPWMSAPLPSSSTI